MSITLASRTEVAGVVAHSAEPCAAQVQDLLQFKKMAASKARLAHNRKSGPKHAAEFVDNSGDTSDLPDETGETAGEAVGEVPGEAAGEAVGEEAGELDCDATNAVR
mmetsp:Transcript_3239/g.6178  ORF Transcript_3239/g.6178 Transcript_3239/m.6178 type:complete len:107 (+) Transcript_3239:1917-2237(+)